MTIRLLDVVRHDVDADVPAEVNHVAARLADRLGGIAVLFYGSVLRTRALGDVLDFYVLTDRARGSVVRRLGLRWLWPDVSYHEMTVADRTIRMKVATMPLATFERAVAGDLIDTTVWVRFAQPCALVWAAGEKARHRTVASVAAAIATAGRFAAALGPKSGTPHDYWTALLRQTYRAELRVEPAGRETQILSHAPDRYDSLLPLAWDAAGIPYGRTGEALSPDLDRRAIVAAWRRRACAGKPLNVARLVKAAFTFDGAARYGLWKVERHTGVHVELTAWRERHPVLAGPGVLWRVFRERRR